VDQYWVVPCVYEEPLVPVEKKKKEFTWVGFHTHFSKIKNLVLGSVFQKIKPGIWF
jgi:hypothetical protein